MLQKSNLLLANTASFSAKVLRSKVVFGSLNSYNINAQLSSLCAFSCNSDECFICSFIRYTNTLVYICPDLILPMGLIIATYCNSSVFKGIIARPLALW